MFSQDSPLSYTHIIYAIPYSIKINSKFLHIKRNYIAGMRKTFFFLRNGHGEEQKKIRIVVYRLSRSTQNLCYNHRFMVWKRFNAHFHAVGCFTIFNMYETYRNRGKEYEIAILWWTLASGRFVDWTKPRPRDQSINFYDFLTIES